jgi:hypothetical protein
VIALISVQNEIRNMVMDLMGVVSRLPEAILKALVAHLALQRKPAEANLAGYGGYHPQKLNDSFWITLRLPPLPPRGRPGVCQILSASALDFSRGRKMPIFFLTVTFKAAQHSVATARRMSSLA